MRRISLRVGRTFRVGSATLTGVVNETQGPTRDTRFDGLDQTWSRGPWSRRSTVIVALVIAIVLALAVLPSPYVVLRPGPTMNVLDELTKDDQSTPIISVDTKTYPTDGSLRLVTVSLLGTPENRTRWLTVMQAAIDPTQKVLPLEDEYGDEESSEERTEQNAALMTSSQEQAAAAAFTRLGDRVPTTLTAVGVVQGGPAEGLLKEGDVIREVAGTTVESFAQMRGLVRQSGAGEELDVTVERDGKRVTVELTPALPDGGDEPMIGVIINPTYDLPHKVDFTLSDIGGPSAGLVFALGLTDLLTPGAMLEGQSVAGTGTIDADGNVGPIDGLTQKLWAADRAGSELFLMPLKNCEMLPGRRPPGMDIAPVATLDEAVDVIEASGKGESVAGIERCDR